MKCPSCGADASGAFCGRCGTPVLSAAECRRCGSALPHDARFCTQCGAAARGAGGRSKLILPVIGVAVLALIGGFWLGNRRAPQPPRAGVEMAASVSPATGAPPPLTGSMRDQADRLFERIMQARARGDSAEVAFFLPMGLQAYGAVTDLDPDGLFHLGLLQLEGGDHDAAEAIAARIRQADPDHLFADALSAEAALAAGDTAAARVAFQAYVARFDRELQRALPEYGMHRPALDEYREQARAYTGA